jgi:hypothetical protein
MLLLILKPSNDGPLFTTLPLTLSLTLIFLELPHKLSDLPTIMKSVNFQLRPPESVFCESIRCKTWITVPL